MSNHRLNEVRDHELEQRRRSTIYFIIFTSAALVVIIGVLLAMYLGSGAQ